MTALAPRLRMLGLVLIAEALLIYPLFQREYHTLSNAVGLVQGSFSIARWGLTFAAFSLFIGYRLRRAQIGALLRIPILSPVSWKFAALHLCALLIFIGAASAAGPYALAIAGVAAILFAAITFVPSGIWPKFFRETATLWICAGAGAAVVSVISRKLWTTWDERRWSFAADMTFWLVRQLLRPFPLTTALDAPAHIIGTDKFQIKIAGVCSGWEGVGLALVFSIVWLWISRRESRFPRALILIPGAMICMFGLNAVRLAALILIGHCGWPKVALSGFHSQAGWIAFNSLALGMTVLAPRIQWLRAADSNTAVTANAGGHNPAIAFLLPFAVILGAGMISSAAADGFEWLYPLRFLAAAAVLWFCRRDYPVRGWRPQWSSLLAGGAVFAMWLALDRGSHSPNSIAAGLAAMSPAARTAWLTFRTLAAVSTVPVAEELAFRGFLARRIVSADFESVDGRRLSWLAITASSLAFGLLHGDRWLAGTLAGFVYAYVMTRRGSLADAIAAHSVTNALLAGWVLAGGRWYFW